MITRLIFLATFALVSLGSAAAEKTPAAGATAPGAPRLKQFVYVLRLVPRLHSRAARKSFKAGGRQKLDGLDLVAAAPRWASLRPNGLFLVSGSGAFVANFPIAARPVWQANG